MIAAVSSTCLVSALGLAFAALKQPRYHIAFERVSGALVLTGLMLLGAGLGIRP